MMFLLVFLLGYALFIVVVGGIVDILTGDFEL
jgi:hypothetical protein